MEKNSNGHATFDDSPFAEEVIVRDYAEQAGPHGSGPGRRSCPTGTMPPSSPTFEVASDPEEEMEIESAANPVSNPEESSPKEEPKQKPPVLGNDFEVEDDEDYLRFKQLDEASKAAYQDQNQEMNYIPPTEDAEAEVLESTRIHQQIVDGGRTTLSEQIYTNLESLIPEALHELSKVKESKFSEQGWDKEVVNTTLREIQQHNASQKKKFAWGPLHETNIKKPLRAFLMEQGLEDAMSPGGQLLFGITVVALVTWLTFKNVKAENQTLERRLLTEIERIVKNGK